MKDEPRHDYKERPIRDGELPPGEAMAEYWRRYEFFGKVGFGEPLVGTPPVRILYGPGTRPRIKELGRNHELGHIEQIQERVDNKPDLTCADLRDESLFNTEVDAWVRTLDRISLDEGKFILDSLSSYKSQAEDEDEWENGRKQIQGFCTLPHVLAEYEPLNWDEDDEGGGAGMPTPLFFDDAGELDEEMGGGGEGREDDNWEMFGDENSPGKPGNKPGGDEGEGGEGDEWDPEGHRDDDTPWDFHEDKGDPDLDDPSAIAAAQLHGMQGLHDWLDDMGFKTKGWKLTPLLQAILGEATT
jgi:hypothetical protein